MRQKINPSIFWAILAAVLYAASVPASKLLLQEVPPTMMAALLYLGAGIGMFLLGLVRKRLIKRPFKQHFTRNDLPYIIGMIILDIAAPILLMIGLAKTTSANASLLNSFEIVATSVIALVVFKEVISRRLWLAIGLITLSSILLSFEDYGALHFSIGSIYVLLACICWGFENNCTRMISQRDPLEIVIIKGFGSGLGALVIAFTVGEQLPSYEYIPLVLLLGFVSYGLSIFFYVYAQRKLGASKTSACYAVTPFIGTALSFLIFRDLPSILFYLALAVMLLATYLTSTDNAGQIDG